MDGLADADATVGKALVSAAATLDDQETQADGPVEVVMDSTSSTYAELAVSSEGIYDTTIEQANATGRMVTLQGELPPGTTLPAANGGANSWTYLEGEDPSETLDIYQYENAEMDLHAVEEVSGEDDLRWRRDLDAASAADVAATVDGGGCGRRYV